MGAAPASALTITDDAASSPQIVNLTGSGEGQVTLSPTTLAFGTVVVNNAVTNNVTLTNNQASSITINSITGFPAAYTQSNVANSCTPTQVIVPGGNCVIAVTLTATAMGAQPGTISVNDTASNSPQIFTVSANAIAPVVLSPTSLSFGAQQVGTTSAAKTVTLNNEQTVALNLSGATITGPNSSDFNVTTTCPLAPASLAASGNCPLQVTFTPGASGTRTAVLNVNDDAPGNPQMIPLTGSGTAPVTVLPGLLTFTAPVGSTSAYQNVTITNASSGSVQFTGLLLSGDFIQTATTCGTLPFTLTPGGHCTVSLEFNPSIGGTRDGQLQVYDTAPTSPQVINLTGSGTYPLTLSASSLSFSAQTVNTSSAAKIITLTNHETESETFTLGTTGDFSATTNCGTGVIAANSSCLVYVTFTPSSVLPSTTRTGTLTVTDSAPGNVFCPVLPVTGALCTVPLTGSAVATKLPAAVAVVSPGAGAAGTSVNVVITGNGWTTFSPSSVISFTDINSGTYPVDITVTSQTFKSINEIDATLTIPANCPLPVTLPCTVEHEVTYGARNIAVTTPLSGGGSEVAQLEQAFIIADPNNQHPITVVAPAFGTQGQASLNVNLTATGTNFDPATTYANFGDGITVNTLTVFDATNAQANITIRNTTPVGYRTITLVTGGEFAVSDTNAFYIGPNDATLDSVSLSSTSVVPVSVPQGWPTIIGQGKVYLTATGTHFLQDATQVSFTGGILVGEVLVTSPTTATVDVAVPANAQIGLQNATVWTGGETATLNNAVSVTGATPLLLSVTPSSAPQGYSSGPLVPSGPPPQVLITANAYMNFQPGQVSATFDGNIASPVVTVIDAQHVSIPISISNNANVGSITANLIVGPSGSTVLYPFTFTVTQSSAAITSVSPSCVPQGGQLTLSVTGINTNWVQGTTTAAFYPVYWVPTPSFDEITITDATDAQLAIAVPTNTPAGSYEFYMATGGQIVNASVNVCAATPTLMMSPSNGLRPFGSAANSFTANFTGQFTHFGPTTEAVISGEGVTLTSFNVTGLYSATATITIISGVNGTPTALGPRKITLTTGGEIVKTYFNVTQTPVGIISVSPYHGPQSTTMNVEIVGLNTHFTQPTTVQFGPQITVNSFTANTDTDLIANITTSFNDNGILPTPPGWQNVYLNSAAGTGFITAAGLPTTTSGAGTGAMVSITASPTGALTSCTAAAGGSGYQVGDYVYPTQAGSADSACQVTVVSGTAIATMITVQEQVITGFLVDSPAMPSLVSVCVTGTGPYSTSAIPCVSSAQQGATVQVTITGSLTNWNSTTEAILGAGVTVANLTNTSPTTETATIAVNPTAPVGGNSVIMFTGSQIVSGTGFNVTPGASLIYSVGPVGCNANGINEIADVCGVSNGAGTPYVITQLQTATLNIVGVGTHWLQGETTASFGAGVATDSLTINSPTTATAQITVLSTSPVGFASLTMTTDGEVTTLQQAIDIEEGFPKILATSPAGGEQGNNITLQVLGRFANWQQGVTSAAFNQDITVNSVTVIDSNNLQLGITVRPWAYVDYEPWISCGHVLTITTGTQQEAGSVGPSGTPGIFCVSQGAEEITSVTPLETLQGSTTPVTITGSATNFIAGVTQVSFGDSNFAIGEIAVSSPTSLTVPVGVSTSATTGFKTVTVTTYGQVASQQYSFTVTPDVGTLNEAIPNQAEQGAPIVTSPTCSTLPNCMVRLIGQYSHFNSQSTATFGAGITVQSVSYVSLTEVDAYITIDPLAYPGGRTVTVTTPGVSCQYQPPVATANVTFTGCTPGSSNGNGSEIVTNNIFSVIPGPAIISNVAPNTGNEGQEVVINITGEATHWAQNFTQFYINGAGYDITVNSVVINSPTSATADISISPNANPGPRSVSMVTNGEALTDRGSFVVTGGIPVISYVTPNSALYGTTGLQVTVVGNDHTTWDDSSTVSFGPGIIVNSFQVDDTSHIEAVLNIGPNCTSPGVPAGCAQLGYRTVVVQTGAQVLSGNFQVTPPPPPPSPYIWYESPSSGIPGQTLTINFIGMYTEWDPNSVTGTQLTGFNADVTVNEFQVTSPNTAFANVTVNPAANSSYSTLTFTTPNTVDYGTEVDYAGFTVVVAQPTLSVVDPGSSMQGTQNLTVNILGQFTAFDSTTTFNFGQGITTNGPPTILGPGIATQSISIDLQANQGWRSVVATTPDAQNLNGVNQVTVGGAGFDVTPSLALISAVTPNTALQGQTQQVEITGQATHWNGSTTTFQFGDGIVVTKHQVNSPTDATVWLSIPAYAGEGATWASATTAGEVANLNNAFVVQAGTPYLLSSGPGSEPQQSSAVFTILSQETNWLTNPPTVSYGDGVVLTNVTVTGNTSLTVDGYIQPTTWVGWRNLTVTSGTQVLGLNSVLYVSPGPAVINNVVANSAGQGATQTVTINGTNTHWQQGVTQLNFPNVQFNGIPQYTVVSPTQITANITINDSAPAGEESISTTTLGEYAYGTNVFTVIQTQPELLGVVPSSGVQGWTGNVALTGQFTSFNTAAGCSPNCTTANFGAGITVNSVTATDSSHATANITVSPTTTLGGRNVTVTTGTEIVSLNNAFQVTVGPAAIVSALSPNSGAQNQPYNVLVVGSQSHFLQGTTTANFGPYIQVTGITVTDNLHAAVAITIPSNTPLNAYDVSLTTGGEVATQLGAFTVTTGSPIIHVVSPPTGHQGDPTFTVNLTGLFTHFNSTSCSVPNPCSTASFGPGITVGTVTATSPTQASVSVTIAPGATIGSRNVTVTTGTETASMTGGFSVLAGVPALLTAAPSSGQAGTTTSVVITGQFTTFQAGFSTVNLGSGINVNFITGVTLTQLTANITIDQAATVGSRDVSVTTNGTTLTLSGGFTVTPGTPFITQISPNIGNPGQTGLTITLTGQYTNWTTASTVTIGSPADLITVVGAAGPGLPGPVVTASATSITVNVSIDATAPVGPAGVSVSTGESVAGGFTVQTVVIPPPSILSISPGMNVGGVPINSNFYLVFSQPMNIATFTTGNVALYLTSNHQGWIAIPIGLSVDATGRVLTITPSSPLAVNSQYYLSLSSNITDATAAHNSINSYGEYFNTVFSAATTQPTVVAFNPPALSTVGTNVPIQLEFSVPMNQGTALSVPSGMVVSTGGNPVPGTFMWNSNPYGSGPSGWGPGTVLYFTPTAPLAANTTYTVSWAAPLADTAGNVVTPGSFTFNTGSGSDTATNYAGSDIPNGLTNVGTNVAPQVWFSKPINPLDINTSTLQLYNSDSGKYINGTVQVALNGMSATFTPAVPLLPDTYYRLYMAWDYYDADSFPFNSGGAYLNGMNTYFTTGNGSDLVAPSVAAISPANSSSSVPLNAQLIVHFDSPLDPDAVSNIITVTPSGGSAISGTVTLASDLVTLFFVPSTTLAPATVYTVQLSGYQDVIGNVGADVSSTFTTMTSIAPLNVSTGFNASGHLITTGDTPDAHWVVVPTGSSTPQPLLVVAPGNGDWCCWQGNGPSSSWVALNPDSSSGNESGTYSTTFDLTGVSTNNLCFGGSMGVYPNATLLLNGTAITNSLNSYSSLVPLLIPLPQSALNATSNTLSLQWDSGATTWGVFRLQGSIQTCGAVLTGGLSLQSATPAYAAGGVATNSTITLVFNNPLDPATVNSTTLSIQVGNSSSQTIAGSYALSTTNVPNDTVVFTPDSPFPVNQYIYVNVYNGPYDLAGDNADTNGLNAYQWITYFNTNGSTATPAPSPFAVTAFSPSNGATNVGLRAPVVATFNRSVNLNSENSSDFALFNGDSQSPWCTSYSHSQDGTSIQFNCGRLPDSATLTAFLGSGLQDWNGDALTPYTSQFSTSYWDSNTNGSIIGIRPGNGSSGINVNLPVVLTTNLPINPGTANSGIQVAQNNVAVPGTVQVLDGGYTLEFTPSVPWTPGALIQWWINGSLTDTTYNTSFNSTSGYFHVAASTDSLTPSVQVAIPSTYSSNVPLNAIFDLQFNTPLNPATVNTASQVYLYDGSNGNLEVPATITQPQPNEIRLVPTSALPANHYIYVNITAALQSTTSVPAASTTWWEYTGTTSDSTTPVVTSAVPMNGETGVGVNVQPGVIFNKSIDPVSVNSNTFQVLNGATPLAGSYWFNSDDTRVDFVPNAPLPANTMLSMSLNGVLDMVGNPVTFSSSFTTGPTPDVTAPSIVWTSFTSNESIPTNSVITVQFSEPMDVSTFTTTQGSNCGNFFIYDTLGSWHCIATTLTWNATQTVAYLQPTTPLAAGRRYYIEVDGGTDIAGNQVGSWDTYFYAEFTSATTAPAVINFNPLDGATGLGTNAIIEAQFSAPIDPNFLSGVTLSQGGSTVTTTPVMSAGNTILQLVPSVPLNTNTVYVLTVAGVKDPAGNTVGTVSSSFTTGPSYDINAPTVVTIDPPNNATVGTNVVAKIVFNKPLNPITVNNSSIEMLLTDTSQWIPLTVTTSANGLEVTLTPQIPLLPNTRYQYYIGNNGYIQDQDGNNVYAGWYYFYTGSGAVTTPLTVTSISPADAAPAIPLNAAVIALVSAQIDPTSWSQNSIQLLNGATPVAGTVSEPNNQELIFTPTNPLAAGITYTVNVSGFTDVNGNAVTPFSSSFTTGAAASTGGLSFTGSNITWGATAASTTQQIVMTFSQNLDPSTVNSNTLRVTDSWGSAGGIAGTYAVNGNQVTFTPTTPYPSGAQISVGECGGPTDILGDVFQNGNCWSQQLVMFYAPSVADTTVLTVLSVNPANGATNVRHDLNPSVTFNKSINPYSIWNHSNTLQLYAGQDIQTNGGFNISADGRTLTFTNGALYNGTTYTIVIPADGVADISGNSLATPFTSTFTTDSNPATGNGSVQSTNPGNTSGVPTDTLLTLYMNRQVNPSSVSASSLTVTVNGQLYAGTVQATAGGYEIQFTPTVPFPNSATVQWFFSSSVMDVYGDNFNGNSGYFYTVAATPDPATAAPTVVAVSPRCCGESNIPTNTNVDIEYNLPIDPTTLAGNVYINSGPATPFTLSQPSPNVVRITPNSPWNNGSTFYGFCTNGSVKGTNGVAATSDCWADYFYTGSTTDTTSGTVKIGPPDGSINIGTNAYIRLQFSKPVDVTTINSTNVSITTGGNPIPGTWSYSYSGSDVIGANFSPVNPLPPSSQINVSVNGLLDYAGNLFSEPTATFTTAATPDYSSPSVSMDFSYWQSGIGTNASFNCRYSEAMDPSSVNSGNTYIYSYVNSANIPVTFTWSSDLMTVTMTPVTPLFANSQYYYGCSGAIDLTGNGQSNDSAGFYTGSGPLSQGPTLLYANPPNGMTNVPLNTNNGPWYGSSLGLLFNEPIASESLGQITLTPNGGSPMPIAVYPEFGNTIAWVQLPWVLAPNTQYTFNITGVTDMSGNAITPVTSTFTTGAGFLWGDPSVISTSPANGFTTTGIPTTTSITFDQAIDPVLVTGSDIYLQTHNTQAFVPTTLSFSADYKTVTLTPTTPLAQSTIYDIVVYGHNFWPYNIAGLGFSTDGYVTYNNGYVYSKFTTGTTPTVDGVCGSANGGSFSVPPTANLCSTGTVSGLTNVAGAMSWSCGGQYGGTAASCSATVTPLGACYAPATAPVSWWKGDDDATDHMGNNNGTLENGAGFALGEVNDAFSFNGSNQFVLIGQPVPADLQIQNNFTMSAWIYVTSYPANVGSGPWQNIFGSELTGYHGIGMYLGGSVSGSYPGVPPGSIDFDIGNGSSWYTVITKSQVPLNQWVLVTATATANNPAQIYYNGVLQPLWTPSGQPVWNGTVSYTGSGFAIGQALGANYSFNGLIDEVQIYNAALTTADVQGIYNAGSAGVCQ
jgi:hypothetical protein